MFVLLKILTNFIYIFRYLRLVQFPVRFCRKKSFWLFWKRVGGRVDEERRVHWRKVVI